MSKGIDFPLEEAQVIAKRCYEVLAPFCDSVQIVGSVRRNKPIVHDIELLCIPLMTEVKDMFEIVTGYTSVLDAHLVDIVSGLDAELIGNGPKVKKFRSPEGLPIEVCISTPDRWAVELVIKTGPAEFSHKCVMIKREGGYLPSNCVIKDGWQVYRNGKLIPMHHESEFLEFLELGWIEPEDRR